jgi:hypothetical protein
VANSQGLSNLAAKISLIARHYQRSAGVGVDSLLQMRRIFNKDNRARGTDMSFQQMSTVGCSVFLADGSMSVNLRLPPL